MERKKDGFENQRAIVLPKSIIDIMLKNDITKLLYVTDIGFYPNARGHYRMRKTGCMQNILLYCTEGEGNVYINGVHFKLYKNSFIIIEAGNSHLYSASENNPWSIYWMHFTGEKSMLFNQFYNKIYTIDKSPISRINDRLQLFEEIYQNLEIGYSNDNLEYTSLCLWHFIASFRFISQFREVNRLKNGNVVCLAINYMRNNIEKRLTLNDIASNIRYSPSHFNEIFLKKTGYTPLKYLAQLKIQKACQLLDFSDLLIKDIADKLGFYDQYHFSKVFLKETGETPSAYRKRIKG